MEYRTNKYFLVVCILLFGLLKFSYADVVNDLIKQAKEDTTYRRAEVAYILGELGDAQVVPVLLSFLTEKGANYEPTMEVYSAIRKIGVPAVTPLVTSLKDENPIIRNAALRLLGDIGDDKAIDAIIPLLKDKNSLVRLNANSALSRLGYKPTSDKERVIYYMAQQYYQPLVEIGKPGVKFLIPYLKDEDSRVCAFTVEVLGTIGDKKATEPILAYVKNNNDNVRESVVRALGKLNDQRAVKPLLESLNDTYWPVRKNAAIALGNLNDMQAISALFNLLKDEQSDVRKAAAEALVKLGKSIK